MTALSKSAILKLEIPLTDHRYVEMSDYPRLKEMGIARPLEIAYFSVNSIDHTDFLRIVYNRSPGSLLPASRSYRFPRIQRKLGADGGATDGQFAMESSHEFREAVDELEKLLSVKEYKSEIADEMLDALRQLQEEVAMHGEYLKVLINKIRKT
ncbi:MAG: DUF3461 family protein [Pseudomonadota bacterium]